MKSFIKTIKLLNAGFLFGTAFWLWVMSEDEKKKKNVNWAGDNPSKMDDIYNHYKEKQTTVRVRPEPPM